MLTSRQPCHALVSDDERTRVRPNRWRSSSVSSTSASASSSAAKLPAMNATNLGPTHC